MNLFTRHPKEVGLSYFGHFFFAWTVIFKLLYAVFCCMIHSVFPFLFTQTASGIISGLNQKIKSRKQA